MKRYIKKVPDYKTALARIDLELVKYYHEHVRLEVLDCGVLGDKELVCFDATPEQMKIIKKSIKTYNLDIKIPNNSLAQKLWFGSNPKNYNHTNFIEYTVDPNYRKCLKLRYDNSCDTCSKELYSKCSILYSCNRLNWINKLIAKLRKIKQRLHIIICEREENNL